MESFRLVFLHDFLKKQTKTYPRHCTVWLGLWTVIFKGGHPITTLCVSDLPEHARHNQRGFPVGIHWDKGLLPITRTAGAICFWYVSLRGLQFNTNGNVNFRPSMKYKYVHLDKLQEKGITFVHITDTRETKSNWHFKINIFNIFIYLSCCHESFGKLAIQKHKQIKHHPNQPYRIPKPS